jgi:hypothetical protein
MNEIIHSSVFIKLMLLYSRSFTNHRLILCNNITVLTSLVSDAGLKEHIGFIHSWVTLIRETDPRFTDFGKSTNFGTFTDFYAFTGVPMLVFSPILVLVPIRNERFPVPVSVLIPVPETFGIGIGTNTKIPTIFLSNLTTDTEIPVDPNRPNAHPCCSIPVG